MYAKKHEHELAVQPSMRGKPGRCTRTTNPAARLIHSRRRTEMASALHRRALIMTLPLCSAGRTDIGKARRRNEDAILVRNEAGLWAVADGLGGHEAGDYASRRAAEGLASLSPTAG